MADVPTPVPTAAPVDTDPAAEPIIRLEDVSLFYGAFRAVRNISYPFRRHAITALIGPSGCGKSTLLRSINRMNDLVPGAHARAACCTTARTCTAPGWIRSRSGGASAWCSRRRTRSPSRSTTTSPSAHA